jgi:hypothetical protein
MNFYKVGLRIAAGLCAALAVVFPAYADALTPLGALFLGLSVEVPESTKPLPPGPRG